jgi:hypothetical protein
MNIAFQFTDIAFQLTDIAFLFTDIAFPFTVLAFLFTNSTTFKLISLKEYNYLFFSSLQIIIRKLVKNLNQSFKN